MDVVGLAVYTIIGVMVALEAQVMPLWLWGPTIAVLSSTGGGILRDFFMGRGLVRTFFYETSFLWGCFLTFYVIYRTDNITASEISRVIILSIIDIFLPCSHF